MRPQWGLTPKLDAVTAYGANRIVLGMIVHQGEEVRQATEVARVVSEACALQMQVTVVDNKTGARGHRYNNVTEWTKDCLGDFRKI